MGNNHIDWLRWEKSNRSFTGLALPRRIPESGSETERKIICQESVTVPSVSRMLTPLRVPAQKASQNRGEGCSSLWIIPSPVVQDFRDLRFGSMCKGMAQPQFSCPEWLPLRFSLLQFFLRAEYQLRIKKKINYGDFILFLSANNFVCNLSHFGVN